MHPSVDDCAREFPFYICSNTADKTRRSSAPTRQSIARTRDGGALTSMQDHATGNRGQTLITFAVLIGGVLAFMGLIFDGGRLYYEKARMQAAAEAGAAGALAGSWEQQRRNTANVEAAAKQSTKLNGFEHGVGGVNVQVTPSAGNTGREPQDRAHRERHLGSDAVLSPGRAVFDGRHESRFRPATDADGELAVSADGRADRPGIPASAGPNDLSEFARWGWSATANAPRPIYERGPAATALHSSRSKLRPNGLSERVC